jgi:hypothetical protein
MRLGDAVNGHVLTTDWTAWVARGRRCIETGKTSVSIRVTRVTAAVRGHLVRQAATGQQRRGWCSRTVSLLRSPFHHYHYPISRLELRLSITVVEVAVS